MKQLPLHLHLWLGQDRPPWPLGSPLSSKFWESTSSPLPHHSSLGSSKLMEKPNRKQNRRSWGRGTRGSRVPGWLPQRGWGDAQTNIALKVNFPDSSPQGGAGVAPVRFKLIRRGPKGAALRPTGAPLSISQGSLLPQARKQVGGGQLSDAWIPALCQCCCPN